MAPQMLSSRRFVAAAIATAAVCLDNAEAAVAVSSVASNALVAQQGASAQGAAGVASSSSLALARGTTARNVRAAQYALAANRGFFAWWPAIGWRWFLGLWASRSWGSGTTASAGVAEKLEKNGSKLDQMVDTTTGASQNSTKYFREKAISAARAHQRSFVFESESEGMLETLSEEGYQVVALSRNEFAMANYMRRVVAEEGLKVVDEETLYDVVKFYDGECAVQSFKNLREEIHRAEHPYLCHKAWTTSAANYEATTEDASIEALAQLGETVLPASNVYTPPSIGSIATLTEMGYQAVANARSTEETMVFIERVLASLNLKVTEMSGLKHFAPYYSGECARQSYARLLKELKRAPTLPQNCGGGWVAAA